MRASATNPITIEELRRTAGFQHRYRREFIQHNLLGPLRRERDVFVGTSSKGVFLVTASEGADTTLSFYSSRIRAELRHSRNLRMLAKRARLSRRPRDSRAAAQKERAVIFLDESGNADVRNFTPPVFVVAGVVIESHQDVSGLEQRFRNALAIIRRPPEQEIRTANLSAAKHARILHELSLLDYQWAAACFHKRRLRSVGFRNPKTLYRYAFQFLIQDLLMIAPQADLVIDEHSGTLFQNQLVSWQRRN